MKTMKRALWSTAIFGIVFLFAMQAFGDSFTVTADGDVGIGTTTAPEATLDVKGSVILGDDALVITEDGHVGIGVNPPLLVVPGTYNIPVPIKVHIAGAMYVDGSLLVNGTVLDNSGSSDARLKENVKPVYNALEKIIQIRGVHYNWIDPSRGRGLQIGVIAQEVEAVFPELVRYDNDGYRSVEYKKLVAPLIEAVKELKEENDRLIAGNKRLEQENQDLKAEIENILDRLDALEQR